MREIKFRAWNKTTGEMNYFDGIWNERPWTERSTFPQYESYPEAHDLSDLTQYTGLKDKNGVEIYEGDILQHPADKQTFVVKWLNASSSFRGVYRDSDKFGGMLGLQVGNKGMAVVIGNIYENPELIDE